LAIRIFLNMRWLALCETTPFLNRLCGRRKTGKANRVARQQATAARPGRAARQSA